MENSLLAGNLCGDWFESHCVASQPVRHLETLPSVTSERPANGGLLRIGYRSPGSEMGRCGSEFADSLRRIFEIFPVLGDSDRSPGSIGTAWRAPQSYLPQSIDQSRELRDILHFGV